MKPFTQIATPHDDILEGRLTMDVFAADLWQVANRKAPIDYQDPDLFFKKTFLTSGLKNILDVAKARLEGKSGDSVIQLQTPFGGGKTHTLIALYHKAKEWNTKVVVFDGTALDPKEIKPWEEIERQLTGKIEITKGDIAPGKEKLIELLSKNCPALILMDEVLEYATKSAGIKIGDSNLSAQTLAFLQELMGAVATIGNSLLVITLPSSVLEHYDENAERMFQQLQKITGRMEKIYTPVKDEEIEDVIRTRLFMNVDEKEAKEIVDEFVEYAKKEDLLSGNELVDYRNRFLKSYPFKPEVIEILYKRWGSFPTFQRTRGVLRLLSLVIYDLLNKNIPFIRLGDFNLSNDELRRELIKHTGQEWESIIAQDITSKDSGAKKVDETLGSSYRTYNLGTCVSTTIFMMSFSGRGEKAATNKEIKLATVYPDFSSTVVDTVISNLKEKLFYLSDEGLFFTNQPNLNRIILSREEDIPLDRIQAEEKRIIETYISKSSKLKVHIFPKFSKDISDTPDLKLIILDKSKPEKDFLEKCGETPRIYRNNLIFLCKDENQKEGFYSYLRKFLALKSIDEDKILNLTEGQRKEVKSKLKSYEKREYEELRKFYRKIFLPVKDGYKEIDMGIATFGESKLDKEIYEYLKNQSEILEKISPKVIKEKYLSDKDYVEIKKLYEALIKTPGELRLVSKDGFIESIKEGVKNGIFGFGKLEEDKITFKTIKETPQIYLTDNEIIIKPELGLQTEETGTEQKVISHESQMTSVNKTETRSEKKKYSKLSLTLDVPKGQISTIAKIVNYLKDKFSKCEIKININASDGEIEVSEYEDKVIEALNQAGVKIVDEKGDES